MKVGQKTRFWGPPWEGPKPSKSAKFCVFDDTKLKMIDVSYAS